MTTQYADPLSMLDDRTIETSAVYEAAEGQRTIGGSCFNPITPPVAKR